MYDLKQGYNIVIRSVKTGTKIKKLGTVLSKNAERNVHAYDKETSQEIYGLALDVMKVNSTGEAISVLVRGVINKNIVEKEFENKLEKIGIYVRYI